MRKKASPPQDQPKAKLAGPPRLFLLNRAPNAIRMSNRSLNVPK
jgi:hypothetical protein